MDPLLILIVLALIATIGAMFLGPLTLSSGGATYREFSTKLMWVRVSLQGLTICR
jgi:hypothetical protein